MDNQKEKELESVTTCTLIEAKKALDKVLCEMATTKEQDQKTKNLYYKILGLSCRIDWEYYQRLTTEGSE